MDYQSWMIDLTNLTQRRVRETRAGVEWAKDRTAITTRWQQAVELIAGIVIDPEELSTMRQADIVETALVTLRTNIIEGIGWDNEGLAFTVPNMFTGEEASIDLRQLPDQPLDN